MAVRIRYFKNYISKELEPSTTNETLKPLIITSTNGGSAKAALPSGGKWAYILIPSLMKYHTNSRSELEYSGMNNIVGPKIENLVGIASGGSTIATFNLHISNGAIAFAGFAWRIA